MATSDDVRALLRKGHSFETAGRELGISPGLAYMLATGRPADGSDAVTPHEVDPALPRGSSQRLIGVPAFNPTRKEHLLEWVAQRAARELHRS